MYCTTQYNNTLAWSMMRMTTSTHRFHHLGCDVMRYDVFYDVFFQVLSTSSPSRYSGYRKNSPRWASRNETSNFPNHVYFWRRGLVRLLR